MICTEGARFTVSIAAGSPWPLSNRPLSSAEAVRLLIELSCLYGFGSDRFRYAHHCDKILSLVTSGFLAALTLPFYRSMKLQPIFLIPSLKLRPTKAIWSEEIQQCAEDIRYYMTLSLHLVSIGSIIWSIFWQPEI